MSGPARTRRLIPVVAVLLVGGVLFFGHLEVMARGPGYAGPLLVVDHLFSLALAAGLLTLAGGVGATLLAAADLLPERAAEGLLHSVALGTGALALLLLLLGVAGLLSGPVLAGALALAGLASARALRDPVSGARRLVREVAARAGDRWLLGAALVATAGAALFLVLHGIQPPGDWDSLMYHLEVPRRWLERGRIYLPEDSLHATFLGPVQLLYLPLLAVGSAPAAALLNGLYALLLALAVFVVGERLLDGEAGSFAALVLWASTGLLLVATTARIDTSLLLFLVLGHGCVVLAALEPSRCREHLVRAGLVLGVAAGVKYHALPYAAALAPVGLWALWRSREGSGARLRPLARAAGAFVVATLPWLLLRQHLVGAPLYPFFTEQLLPGWLAGLYGGPSYPPGLDPESLRLLGQAREPFDLAAFFLAPERITVEPEGVHYNANFLLLLLPLWLLHLRRRALAALIVPGLLYAGFVVVPFETTNLRYLFPALVPLTLASAFMAVELARRIPRAGLRRAVLIGAAAGLLLPTLRSGAAWTRKAPVVGHAVGTVSAQEYLAAGFPFYASLLGGVNRRVEPGGKVLLLWEARGFHMAPDHLQDNVLRNWPLLVPHLERTGSCLEETGVTHVLVSTAAVRFYASRGMDAERLRWDRFEAFRERCLSVEEEGGGWTLYRLGPP